MFELLKTDEIYIGGMTVPCYVYEYKVGNTVRFPRVKERPINFKKGKHKLEYLPVYSGYDIETSNIINDDNYLLREINVERNRTSAIAFVNNRFEFRGLGSSKSIAFTNKHVETIYTQPKNFMQCAQKYQSFAKSL